MLTKLDISTSKKSSEVRNTNQSDEKNQDAQMNDRLSDLFKKKEKSRIKQILNHKYKLF